MKTQHVYLVTCLVGPAACPATWTASARPIVVPGSGPRILPHPPCSQPASLPVASEPEPSIPPPAKRTKTEQASEPTWLTKGEGKGLKAKPSPQPGRWVDRDWHAALNTQCFGESKCCPLELCLCQSRKGCHPKEGSTLAWATRRPGLPRPGLQAAARMSTQGPAAAGDYCATT